MKKKYVLILLSNDNTNKHKLRKITHTNKPSEKFCTFVAWTIKASICPPLISGPSSCNFFTTKYLRISVSSAIFCIGDADYSIRISNHGINI